MSKLKNKDIPTIRRMGEQGKFRKNEKGGNYKKIANKFNVSPAIVGQIVRGERWQHI